MIVCMSNARQNNKKDDVTDASDRRLYVSFTIVGKDLIPDEITSKLGIEPSHSFKRGDTKIRGREKTEIWKHGFWSLESSNVGLPTDDLKQHFEWLLDMLEPTEDELKDIIANGSFDARVSCFWITSNDRINVEIEPGILVRLAKLNIRVWLDIYCGR